jgi:hypothetical protein
MEASEEGRSSMVLVPFLEGKGTKIFIIEACGLLINLSETLAATQSVVYLHAISAVFKFVMRQRSRVQNEQTGRSNVYLMRSCL